MNKNNLMTHTLGSLLILSTLYHSLTIYSITVLIPFALVSYSVQKGKERLLFFSLIFATSASCLFIASDTMNETFSFLVFSATFGFPLFLYWITALLDLKDIEWKPIGIALSYVLIVCLVFYMLPEFLEITEFILSSENRIPQILIFFGTGMVVGVPFHLILELRD